MAEHVRRDEDVLRRAVAAGKIRMPGIARKHHLEEPRVAHAVLHELIDVAHAERPVRHAHRQAVHGDFHHEAVRHLLEVHRMEIRP